jgi:hypothetical protein
MEPKRLTEKLGIEYPLIHIHSFLLPGCIVNGSLRFGEISSATLGD